MFSSNTSQVSNNANYIEDVFSTWLYTGTGTNQTITNGIDASTKGALFWIKCRSSAEGNRLVDTVRGPNYSLESNWNGPQDNDSNRSVTATTSGFTTGPTASSPNTSGEKYVSWTFAEQPKFFDVVTFTGTQNYGGSGQTVSHNLGSTPGCIIIKPLSDTSGSGFTLNDWIVYHRGLSSPTTQFLKLNSTASIDGNSDKVRAVSSTTFTAGWEVGLNGIQYIAYVFAHDAGGFGLTGTDNVISCGSVTANGSGAATINLGYEPQWIMIKNITNADSWYIFDNMRGLYAPTQLSPTLRANIANAEVNSGNSPRPSATGVSWTAGDTVLTASNTYIYIAIRRGPMKVPTIGTSVFAPVTWTGTGSGARVITGAPQAPDMVLENTRSNSNNYWNWFDRLRGFSNTLYPYATAQQGTDQGLNYGCKVMNMNGHTLGDLDGGTGGYNASGTLAFAYYLTRAPSFFDEVCYTGTGPTPQNINHNLGVAPELMIVKVRSVSGDDWVVYCSKVTDANIVNLRLNKTQAIDYNGDIWDATTPTATTFRVGQSVLSNYGGQRLVAYLFATCAGVSKVGSYTGTSATQTIACGFTGGARFVMIKRTDSTGDWVVWDTGRGMVAGTDPRMAINSTVAETNQNWVYTATGGFQIVTADSSVNSSGGTYIFLAIA